MDYNLQIYELMILPNSDKIKYLCYYIYLNWYKNYNQYLDKNNFVI